jgi:SAM-dependent methyltransferase
MEQNVPDDYDPQCYWESRLSRDFTLRGVGHLGFSESYNKWLYRRKERCLRRALLRYSLVEKNVLDIGCGTGFFLRWYISHGAQVCGIDITRTSIERLRKTIAAPLSVQDITAPDFTSTNRFDIVNMWDVIYHVVDPIKMERAFRNISASLTDGGLLLFTDTFGSSENLSPAPHVRNRGLATYQSILPRLGFRLVKLEPLYRMLDKAHFGWLDNYLASVYFMMDCLTWTVSDANLSLGVWQLSKCR